MNSADKLAPEELLGFLAQYDDDCAGADAPPLSLEPIVAGPAEPPLLRADERWGLSTEERELLLLVLQDDETDEPQSNGILGNATSNTTTTTVAKRKKKKKPRPNRRRRKHEVDELRVEVAELEEKLLQLRSERRALIETALMARGTLSRTESGAGAAPPSMWERIGRFEREEARAAVTENLRLRAMYASQLLTLQRLETAYRSQFDLEVRRRAHRLPVLRDLVGGRGWLWPDGLSVCSCMLLWGGGLAGGGAASGRSIRPPTQQASAQRPVRRRLCDLRIARPGLRRPVRRHRPDPRGRRTATL